MRLKKSVVRLLGISGATLIIAAGITTYAATRYYPRELLPQNDLTKTMEGWLEPKLQRVAVKDPIARKIVAAAHAQEGDAYNASYRKISYPGGDVPKGGGACTDVIVRAFRGAGYDLQKLIHEDMAQDFGRYPDPWKLGHTDKNIDHRRVPNHIAFFKKYGQVLPNETSGEALKTWLPGDVVVWKWGGGKWHTGIISDAIGPSGKPMVIHNGWMCTEQDYLTGWPIAGHFRYPAKGSPYIG
jgi:uncharacterized protein YijF (DUF1287 family)